MKPGITLGFIAHLNMKPVSIRHIHTPQCVIVTLPAATEVPAMPEGHVGWLRISPEAALQAPEIRKAFLQDYLQLLERIKQKYLAQVARDHGTPFAHHPATVSANVEVFSAFQKRCHLDPQGFALATLDQPTACAWLVIKPMLAQLNWELSQPGIAAALLGKVSLQLPFALSKCAPIIAENLSELLQAVRFGHDGLRGKVSDLQFRICQEVIAEYVRWRFPGLMPGEERHFGITLRDRLAATFSLPDTEDFLQSKRWEPGQQELDICIARINKKLATTVLAELAQDLFTCVAQELFQSASAPNPQTPDSRAVIDRSLHTLEDHQSFCAQLSSLLKEFGVHDETAVIRVEHDECYQIQKIHLRQDDTELQVALLHALEAQGLWTLAHASHPSGESLPQLPPEQADSQLNPSSAPQPLQHSGVHQFGKLAWIRESGATRQIDLQDLVSSTAAPRISPEAYLIPINLQQVMQHSRDLATLEGLPASPALPLLGIEVLIQCKTDAIVDYLCACAEHHTEAVRHYLRDHHAALLGKFVTAKEKAIASVGIVFKKTCPFERYEKPLAQLLNLEASLNTDVVRQGIQQTSLAPHALRGMVALRDEAGVQQLLASNVDAGGQDELGRTVLHLVVGSGQSALLKSLLNNAPAHAAIDRQTTGGLTALQFACRNADVACVEILLDAGAARNARDARGQSALFIASAKGDPVVVQALLSGNADATLKDNRNVTALFIAAQNGHAKVVGKLLAAPGIAIHELCGPAGVTALQIAAFHGRSEVVKTLLAAGADVNAENPLGRTALYYASGKGHHATVQVLLDGKADATLRHQEGVTDLHIAAQKGHVEVVKLLLARGASVNAQDALGNTALFHASGMGHPATVQVLLDGKADATLRHKDGATTLHIAALNGHPEVVKMLLAAGVSVNAGDPLGRTALFYASGQGHHATVQALLDGEADATLRHWEDATALHIAALNGHAEVAKTLLAAGVNVNAQDALGRTALFHASGKGHHAVVQALLDGKADATLMENGGASALSIATRNGHTKVVTILLASGTNMHV